MKKKTRKYKKRKGEPLHPNDLELTKKCDGCQRELGLDRFYHGKSNKFGRRQHCISCYIMDVLYRYQLAPQKVIFRKRAWQKKFKKRKNKTNREYYLRNREKISKKELARYHRKRAEKLAQNTRQINQCIPDTAQSQSLGVESPLAQTPECAAHQDYHFLVSCAVIYTFL